MNKCTKSLLIIDDHPVVHMGLSNTLFPERLFDEIDSAYNGKEAILKLKAAKQKTIKDPECHGYDLIIADIGLPDYEINSLIKNCVTLLPETPILIFSLSPPHLHFQNLLEIGIKGFISKNVTQEEVLFAIKNILRGKTFFGSELIQDFIKIETGTNEDPFPKLSNRENEILSLTLKGKSIKEICSLVSLHKSSVATYKARIYEKIGVANSMELYQWATKKNLIDPH